KVKKIGRAAINQAVLAVMTQSHIKCNREIFRDTLPLYVKHPKLSFVDCYLCVVAERSDAAPLLTFDEKLAKQIPAAGLLTGGSD
ncbi:MAG: hypothetical protein LBT68_06790, partial [Spirochaetales bacterium]|nr:hypothetical protein [Spirochaetales bacterium]